MRLGAYLSPARTLLVESDTKEAAIEELVATLCHEDSRLDLRKSLDAIFERERSVSSRIAPQIALPHALLPDYRGQLAAVGFSRAGVPWDAPDGQPVNLILVSLCGESKADDHIRMLAEFAQVLRDPGLLPRLARVRTGRELFDVLQKPAVAPTMEAGDRKLELCRSMVRHACALAGETCASTLMILADEALPLDQLGKPDCDTPLIVALDDALSVVPPATELGAVLPVPFRTLRRSHRVKLAFLFALSHGLIDKDDTVVCVSGDPSTGLLHAMEIVDVAKQFNVLLSLRSELTTGDIGGHVLDRVLHIAASLAREGREGRPVGTLFVLGDYDNVRTRCRQLVMNPFRGCPENERSVLDPSLEETIKEFSRIDGAFLIRGDGTIMSMGSYIRTDNVTGELPAGLGARHAAGMAITESTKALSIVISESTRCISLFRQGSLVMTLDQASG